MRLPLELRSERGRRCARLLLKAGQAWKGTLSERGGHLSASATGHGGQAARLAGMSDGIGDPVDRGPRRSSRESRAPSEEWPIPWMNQWCDPVAGSLPSPAR